MNDDVLDLKPIATDDAETILNATLIDRPELLDDIELSHDDFADERAQLVFRTICWMADHDKAITSSTVMSKLAKRLAPEYLATVCNVVYSMPWAVRDHARIIKDESIRRKMVRTGQKLIELSQTSEDVTDAIAEAEKTFAELSVASERDDGLSHIGDVMSSYWDELENRYTHKGELVGVTTGFRELDGSIGGWRPTDLCIVAARPSMGKTAFMLQSAMSGAVNDVVIVFSIEMGATSLIDRLMSSESNVPLYNIRNGRIKDDQWAQITTAFGVVSSRNLYVDDHVRVTIPYVRSQIRRIQRHVKDGRKMVVFLDYLQLIKSTVKGRSRTEEVGDISQELKAIAKELNCCVVALAQLSRDVEKRSDKHPTLSDIRESGQIEQDADVIAFLYRDEYYNPNTERPNVVEVIIGKNRNGPIGTAEIAFLKEFQRFVDLDKEAK